MKKAIKMINIIAILLMVGVMIFSNYGVREVEALNLDKALNFKIDAAVYEDSKKLERGTKDSEDAINVWTFGTYEDVSKTDVLNELNRIRQEACNEGINGLTPSDYVPLKWSVDLERITKIRAVEGYLLVSHTRPNGESCFTVTSNGHHGYGENLAWNWSVDLTMSAIQQYYEEKEDLINNTGGVTGHYTSIINPNFKTVGTSGFHYDEDMTNMGWGCNAMQFSVYDNLPDGDSGMIGYHEVLVEILPQYYQGKDSVQAPEVVSVGETQELGLWGNFKFNEEEWYKTEVVGLIKEDIGWEVSDQNIADLVTLSDAIGIKGVAPGTVDLECEFRGETETTQVEVVGDALEDIIIEPQNPTPDGYVRVVVDFGENGNITGVKTFDVREGLQWSAVKAHLPGIDELQGEVGYLFEGFTPSLPEDDDALNNDVTYTASYEELPRIIYDENADKPDGYFEITFEFGGLFAPDFTTLYVHPDVKWSEVRENIPEFNEGMIYEFKGFTPEWPADSVAVSDMEFVAEYDLVRIIKDPNIESPAGYHEVTFEAESPLVIEEGKKFYVQEGVVWEEFKEYLPSVMGKFDYDFDKFDPMIPGDEELVADSSFIAQKKVVDFLRFKGSSRITTAIEICKGFKDTSDNVVLAVATSFPDALSGAPLAKKLDAPMLLTNKNSLPNATKEELQRLGTKKVYILGGNGAISQNVENQVRAVVSDVERIGGATRFETSYNIAQKVLEGTTGVDAFIASGLNYPDALAAGPIAASKGSPIILTSSNRIDPLVKSLLESDSITGIIVNGGSIAISDQLYSELENIGKSIHRNAGDSRVSTALEIAKNENPDAEYLYFSTAYNFPDALAGSVMAANKDGVILLTHPNYMSGELKNYVEGKYDENEATYSRVFGGYSAVSQSVENVIRGIIADH